MCIRESFKGFQYVKITKDENGNYFKEDSIREYVSKCFYIISVMKKTGIGTAIYKYKVPYMSLLDFIDKFKINKDYGEIIDIERYIPEDSA
ncbi:MAG: hypothetical protein LUG16_05760 [Candidatus Gastranaerophilales bacterium]|nr:hypothetical protein [Candidatus Gastranaerophilales bacterium]